MDDKKYNGWTNYETWIVNLWIDNDEGAEGYWGEKAQEAYDDAEASESPTFTREEQATLDLSDVLKEEIENAPEEINPLSEKSGMYSDLLNAALSAVNWHEIAVHLIEETDKEESEEEENAGEK